MLPHALGEEQYVRHPSGPNPRGQYFWGRNERRNAERFRQNSNLTIAASVRFSIFLKSLSSASELATALKCGSGDIMLSPHDANQ